MIRQAVYNCYLRRIDTAEEEISSRGRVTQNGLGGQAWLCVWVH